MRPSTLGRRDPQGGPPEAKFGVTLPLPASAADGLDYIFTAGHIFTAGVDCEG